MTTELANEVIAMAFAMDMWVFGGYVRDVVVRKQQMFGDLDICCSRAKTNVSQFIRALGARFDVTMHDSRKFKNTYGAMSPGITRIHKCTVVEGDTRVRVDVVSFDGSFDDWCDERTVDFTCNLFYMKREVALGLRYVPECLKHHPTPMQKLIDMTIAQDFHRIWDVPGGVSCHCVNVIRIHDRAKELVKRGWYMPSTPTLMSERMSHEIDEKPYAQTECGRMQGFIDHLQSRRAVRQLEEMTGRDAVTRRIRTML
jgi:hypothetical protein